MLVLKTQRRVIVDLAFAPSGRGLVAAGWSGIYWWADPVADPTARQLGTEAAWSVGVTAAGDCVIASLLAGGVRTIGLSGQTRRTILESVRNVQAAVSPIDPLVVTCGPRGEGQLTGWQIEAAQSPAPVWSVDNETELSNLGFAPDGSWLVHRDYRWWARKKRFTSWVIFRDPATGEVRHSVEVPDNDAWAGASVSRDGEWLATLHTTRTSVTIRRLAGNTSLVRVVERESKKDFTNLAFHPTGRYLAVTSNDTTVRLYDAATWEVAAAFAWGIGKLRCVAFSPDGSLAAAGSDTGQVVVWDVDL